LHSIEIDIMELIQFETVGCSWGSSNVGSSKRLRSVHQLIVTSILNSTMNRIYALRHGLSIPNTKGVIVSRLENGVMARNGLSEMGRKQADEAGLKLKEFIDGCQVVCYHSPFSRTTETALRAIHAAGVRKPLVISSEALRERDFGSFNEEKPADEVYEKTWEQDRLTIESKAGDDGETLHNVQIRCLAFIKGLNDAHKGQGKVILLVSHGDTLSILESTLLGLDVRAHRDLAYATGELRRIQ
jgi:broad specificity phosphatase PhoE